jgi:hypothetical protein
MKKRAKKLVLAKETVRNLEERKLPEARGGLCMSDIDQSCPSLATECSYCCN